MQQVFRKLFNGAEIAVDGTPFEQPFADKERFWIGALELRVLHTTGHTPDCVGYWGASDAGPDVFIGAALFMPDYGSPRAKTLAKPVLLLPAIQVNLRAGQLPAPGANGVRYLKISLNVLQLGCQTTRRCAPAQRS